MNTKLSDYLQRMKLDFYSFDLYRERMSKFHTLLIVYPPHTLNQILKRKKPGFEI